MIQRFSRWLAVVGVGLALCTTTVHALTFDKTLVVATVEQLQKGVTFPLLGLNEEATRFVSVRVFEWHQDKVSNVILKPTSAFDVFPQLLRVPRDSRRTVTIKLRPGEVSSGFYRLVLEEFDSLQAADEAGREQSQSTVGVVTKPKVTIPMVIGDSKDLIKADLPPEIQVVATARPKDKKMIFDITNPSDKAIRLSSLQYKGKDTETIQVLQYMLPGITRTIEVAITEPEPWAFANDSFQATAAVVGSEVMKTFPVKMMGNKP